MISKVYTIPICSGPGLMEKPHGRETDPQTQKAAKRHHNPETGQSQKRPEIISNKIKQWKHTPNVGL